MTAIGQEQTCNIDSLWLFPVRVLSSGQGIALLYILSCLFICRQTFYNIYADIHDVTVKALNPACGNREARISKGARNAL